MLNDPKKLSPESTFKLAWIIVGVMTITQIIFIVICQLLETEIQQGVNEEQRILIRTVFYLIAIATFPLTTLIRHVFVRLNQTMPGAKTANQRYLLTVVVSQSIMSVVGVLGFVMFILGDDFNTLYIFSALAVLGFFLQRPKQDEYQAIVDALKYRQ